MHHKDADGTVYMFPLEVSEGRGKALFPDGEEVVIEFADLPDYTDLPRYVYACDFSESDGVYAILNAKVDTNRTEFRGELLDQPGISEKLSALIALRFHPDEVEENPYVLMEVPGLRPGQEWETVDRIAREKYEVPLDDIRRKVAAVQYVMEKFGRGSTHFTSDELLKAFERAIEERTDLRFELDDLTGSEVLCVDGDDPKFYTLPKWKWAEEVIAESKDRLRYLTGKAGSGKTEKAVCEVKRLRGLGRSVCVVAPTAMAARNFNEEYGIREGSATTIHRLLYHKFRKINDHKAGNFEVFVRPDDASVGIDDIVIDEASMVDTMLLAQLLHAVPEARFLMVGDSSQLAPVGPGAPFYNLVEAPSVKGEKLPDKNYRSNALLVENANRVLDGKRVVPDECLEWECLESDIEQDIDLERVAKYATGIGNELILARRNIVRKKLNDVLRKHLNSSNQVKSIFRYKKFAVGDPIMHLKNTYVDDGRTPLLNGDKGRVVDIDTANKEVLVKYEHCYEPVIYSGKSGSYKPVGALPLDHMDVAYCVTVHKAQGQGHGTVIVYIARESTSLDQNLLYTAITRAKCRCIVIAPESVMERSESLLKSRTTRLEAKLNEHP